MVRQRILVRLQQGEQTAAGREFVFQYPLGSVLTPHFTDGPDALQADICNVLGGYNHLLSRLPVLGCDELYLIVEYFLLLPLQKGLHQISHMVVFKELVEAERGPD